MSLYSSIRTWLQPYWKPNPRKKSLLSALKAATKVSEPACESQAKTHKSVNGDPHIKISIRSSNTPLTGAMKFKVKPKGDAIWCYHDDKVFQVFAHFDKAFNAGHKFPERHNKSRKNMKPIIFPLDRKFDKAHLIPIGYHGSDSDKRLLIGWDAGQNKMEQRNFEIEVKQYNHDHPIYWFVHVSKVKEGLMWQYRIYDADTEACVKKLDLVMKCSKYVWR